MYKPKTRRPTDRYEKVKSELSAATRRPAALTKGGEWGIMYNVIIDNWVVYPKIQKVELEMAKEILLTAQGLKNIEDELDYLKTVKRKEMADKIALARSYGDLSENSEYDDAKNEQAQMEARIADLEVTLKHAKVIDESEISNEHVHIGSSVTVYNQLLEEESKYRIVSASESDPENGMISDESPVGKALLDSKIGDKVTVDLPNGTQLVMEIRDIAR